MTLKIKSIEEGFDEIEKIDTKISDFLNVEDYSAIFKLLKERMIYITEVNIIKGEKKLSPNLNARAAKIFATADQMQKKVLELKGKISKRLGGRRKLFAQNKNFGY